MKKSTIILLAIVITLISYSLGRALTDPMMPPENPAHPLYNYGKAGITKYHYLNEFLFTDLIKGAIDCLKNKDFVCLSNHLSDLEEMSRHAFYRVQAKEHPNTFMTEEYNNNHACISIELRLAALEYGTIDAYRTKIEEEVKYREKAENMIGMLKSFANETISMIGENDHCGYSGKIGVPSLLVQKLRATAEIAEKKPYN